MNLSARKHHLKRYGLTPEQYDNLSTQQGGVCAICSKPCVTGAKLAVDHCHETGRIRALLCQPCNTGLGKFGDSPAQLRRAATYLERQ